MPVNFYSLTPQEEAICVEVGYQRQKPYFGDPTRNMNYSEGDLWEMWQHVVCAGSELAFARMMGDAEFVPHFNKWKSELDIPGWGEVRYSFNPTRGLRFTDRDDPELKYVLLVDGLAKRPSKQDPLLYKSEPYVVVGWMYGADCMDDEYRFNGKTWYVPVNHLRSLESLNASV
jgi:hypothetical protein